MTATSCSMMNHSKCMSEGGQILSIPCRCRCVEGLRFCGPSWWSSCQRRLHVAFETGSPKPPDPGQQKSGAYELTSCRTCRAGGPQDHDNDVLGLSGLPAMTVTQPTSSPSAATGHPGPPAAVWGLPCQLTIMQMPWSLHDGDLVQGDKQSP